MHTKFTCVFVNAPLWSIFLFIRLTQYICCSSYNIYLVHFFCYLLITSVSTNMPTKPTSVFSTFTEKNREYSVTPAATCVACVDPLRSGPRLVFVNRNRHNLRSKHRRLQTALRAIHHCYCRVSETERKLTHM